jgi:hypothetical protein
MSGHSPLVWLLLGASLAWLIAAPVYWRLGMRDGYRRALRRVDERAWKSGR